MCHNEENWKHDLLCDAGKSIREEWVVKLHTKLCKNESYKWVNYDEIQKIQIIVNDVNFF